jgi:hypothetical protein
MDSKIRRDIETKVSVPLWPTTGKALGLGRSSTYEAGRSGAIPTIDIPGIRKKPVPTSWLRKKLGL